ncbi:Protein of unknown function [Bacillus mycoides]|uniref:Uncharacterized protein n=1 Tax=Bacillus mycoides TaxID=1405 RepID=A0A1C4BSZ6_BACMY|nr:Protein of unknown function [Bacillus mycoides]SCC09862.1 Protein of unknown function [Bacillus mycoides]SCM86371.1 Protein of unknown function [Bacillus mycoides]
MSDFISIQNVATEKKLGENRAAYKNLIGLT